MKLIAVAAILLSSGSMLLAAGAKKKPETYGMVPITYPCKFDDSMQPAMLLKAEGDEPRPLVVALHTWGGKHSSPSQYRRYAIEAKKYNYHLIFPNFRGPNRNFNAGGSELVVSDLEDAVSYMKKTVKVDPARIYLTGGSGGGHCSLLMAGRRPDLWTAVSSWCPISDLKAWHQESLTRKNRYGKYVEQICGGNPQTSERAALEARKRSPLTWLPNAREQGLPVDINTGINDGHRGSVKISHSFNAFNRMADPEDRFTDEEIKYMVEKRDIPENLRFKGDDPAYTSGYPVLLRRQSGNVRITIFKGGHDILPATAFDWLSRQKKGAAPDWGTGKFIKHVGKKTLGK